MKGKIKTYLKNKGYGFIKGDDGKDYFFHEEDFKNKKDVSNLYEGSYIDFDEYATPKGYKARSCRLLDESKIITYVVPESFKVFKSDRIREWEIIEYGKWIVYGSSSDSPESAKNEIIERAKSIGANSIINIEYYKTTGEDGNYRYTIHNYKGNIANLAKKHAQGNILKKELLGLNESANKIKKELSRKTKNSIRKSKAVWLIAIVASIISYTIKKYEYIIGIVIAAIGFGNPTYYDNWLESDNKHNK